MNNTQHSDAAVAAVPTPSIPVAGMDDMDLAGDVEIRPAGKRRSWPWILLILLAAALFAGYRWKQSAATSAVPSYKTVAVTFGDITQSVTANGQITPIKTVTVGSQVSGQIIDIKVDFNSPVTNGQTVAQLDPSTYQQLLIQAEADTANARAALALAKLTYNRNKELLAGKALPVSDYENSEAALLQAQASVKSKEAALKKAQVDLERTTIYSPIDGIVISRAVDVGQTVAASLNAPTLFTIAQDLRKMHIEAAVSEADVGGVKEGQTVRFTVDAYPNHTFNGQITQVRYDATTNQNVINYTTIVEVNNDDLKLRPGMTANATIVTAERENVLRIPNAALRYKPAATSSKTDGASQPAPDATARKTSTGRKGTDAPVRVVYVATEQGEPVATTVTTGINDSSWTEVTGGLKETDLVVTGTITTPAAPAAAGNSNPFSGNTRPR